MILRAIQSEIELGLSKQKVSLLLGARRVGKTILLQNIFKKNLQDSIWLNGEDADVQKILENRSIANYQRLLQNKSVLVIDEAQFVPDIGRKAKLMIDNISPLHIILTGSSAFDVQQAGEPLVGRTITYQLYPIAQMELNENPLDIQRNLEDRLLLGSYPELFGMKNSKEKQLYLLELINTYLLKDILVFENIRNPQKLKDLLTLLAYQIGHEVSLEELGKQLGISKNTVERYLDLLSKVFVIYNRRGFSRNLRKEVSKNQRWHFFDNGIRNALINNFNPLALRQDVGQLWENYLLSERIKKNAYTHRIVNSYFWRTYDQQEIDLIEEEHATIAAFECKWKTGKTKTPAAFKNAYPDASFQVVNQDNYVEWIG
jgi:uncharacterized protein